MPSSSLSQEPVCEQCGAPLRNGAGEGCLNCLLQSGLEDQAGEAESARGTYLHYKILQRPDGSFWELGRGEIGVTYKAHDVNLDTIVALKVLAADFSARPEACGEVRRAVQAAAQVHHPNVAEVLHFGTVEGASTGTPAENSPGCECFYTMEFVEGESLEERVLRHGPLGPLTALEIALQVASALAEAGKRGLVNRALKVSNVMLSSDQSIAARSGEERGIVWVKVVNLGLDLRRHAGASAGLLHDDLYSLGRILCFALCGERPAGDGALPGAELRARRVPPAVVALLELLLGPDDGKPPPSLVTVIGLFESSLGSLTEAARQRRRRWAFFGVLALSAALIGLAVYATHWSSPAAKSIAVLPFANLSQNPTDAFFAEGVRDDIVSRLVRIRDLKVIGHPRTELLPADRTPDFRSIGRELGASHLLTGSLRRSGDRVMLEISLVDATNGHQIWSEKYDRKLKDAINLQGELASNVADALDGRLSADEGADVQASSTLHPDAYALYLQARKLENSASVQISNYEAAAALYTQAVALDPGFALAHAQLANVLGSLYRFRGPSDELRIQAASEVREALRLEPDLGEGHLVKGANLYRIERDFEGALTELQIARNLLPNGAAPNAFIAMICGREGRWLEARAGLERAHQLDPQVRRYEDELHATACLLRDWPAAARHADLALAISPDELQMRFERALVDYWQSGHLQPLQKQIASVATLPDTKGDLTWMRWDVAMLVRDYVAADAVLDAFPLETLPTVLGAPIPKSYLKGCIWLAKGDRGQAHAAFEMARPSMEAETFAQPEDAMRHARLGLLYAYLGKKAEAIREGKRAVEITPVSEDAIDGHLWVCNLALIHAWVGDPAEAVALADSLLRQPGCVSPLNEASLTLSDLRTRWQWDPLRQDPRFKRILAAPEPPTAY